VILLVSFFHFARRWLRNGPDLTLTPVDASAKHVALHSIDY
jgi:cytochrome d ubiquinol oxidase subunit I